MDKDFEDWFLEGINKPNLSDCSLLDKVTIVIPSYERQSYLLRQILYWHGTGVSLLILDGSNSALPDNISAAILNRKELTYLHLPISFEARLKKAINYIKTPYVASLSDDEFFLKSALNNLVLKLENDSSLSGCIGQSLGFDFDKNSNGMVFSNGYPHWEFSATHEDIKDRLAYAMNPYNAVTAYGLFKKDIWQAGWGEIVSYSCAYTSEMHQALTTYLTGKYIATDELYWLRSSENAPVDTVGWDRKLHFHEWWNDPQYKEEKELFFSKLEKIAVEYQNVSKEKAREIIYNAVEHYLAFCDAYFKQSWKTKLRMLIAKLLRGILPGTAFQKLKLVFALKNTKKTPLTKDTKYPWLAFTRSNNVEENQKEMQEIETLIKEFHSLK